MDPERRPFPFKTYSGELEELQLPDRRDEWLQGSADATLDLEGISRLLLLGAGAKRYRNQRLRGRYFRTYASAGALHPNEIYVAVPELDGIPAGLYHFDPRGRALVALGRGDARPQLAEAAGDESLLDYPVLILVTGIPWRTSWKYTERGYRHLWWDAGMILANLIALADATSMRSRVVAQFVDDSVNALLGIDGVDEMSLAIVGFGRGAPQAGKEFSSFHLQGEPVGPDPYEFTKITGVHRATSLDSPPVTGGPGEEFAPSSLPGSESVEAIIWKRGSTRSFDADGVISRSTALEILQYASQPLGSDWERGLCELFIIANSIDTVERGGYKWSQRNLELIRKDPDSRESAAFLSLEQDLGGDGSLVVFPMADLDRATTALGGRGYRIAQLEGAIISGRLYLSAYASGLGCTGLTFYDDEVRKYFGATSTPMLEVAIGVPATVLTI